MTITFNTLFDSNLVFAYNFFSCFAFILSFLIIYSTKIIYSILFLILFFFNIACIMLVLKIEFISVLIILIYVTAITIFFLFIVMTTNIKTIGSNFILKITHFINFIFVTSLIFFENMNNILNYLTNFSFNTFYNKYYYNYSLKNSSEVCKDFFLMYRRPARFTTRKYMESSGFFNDISFYIDPNVDYNDNDCGSCLIDEDIGSTCVSCKLEKDSQFEFETSRYLNFLAKSSKVHPAVKDDVHCLSIVDIHLDYEDYLDELGCVALICSGFIDDLAFFLYLNKADLDAQLGYSASVLDYFLINSKQLTKDEIISPTIFGFFDDCYTQYRLYTSPFTIAYDRFKLELSFPNSYIDYITSDFFKKLKSNAFFDLSINEVLNKDLPINYSIYSNFDFHSIFYNTFILELFTIGLILLITLVGIIILKNRRNL